MISNRIQLNLNITFAAFPAWKPDGQKPMCAKFANFYETKCWDPVMDKLKQNISNLNGIERLQRK